MEKLVKSKYFAFVLSGFLLLLGEFLDFVILEKVEFVEC